MTTSRKMMMAAAGGEECPDSDTLLLIESDDTDGSTTFTDKSSYGRTVTVVADSKHKTTYPKFGASSIYLDGSADLLTLPDSGDWVFSGDFTIEIFIRIGTYRGILEQATAAGASNTNFTMYMGVAGSQVRAQVSNGSSFTVSLTSSTHLGNSAWHHIALVRDGNDWDLFIDGTSESTTSATVTLNNVSAPLTIGDCKNDGAGSFFNGHMQGIRISNVARYPGGTSFTPPTALFC